MASQGYSISRFKHQASRIDILPCRRTRTTRELLNEDLSSRFVQPLAVGMICWNPTSLGSQTLPTFQHVKLIKCKQPLPVKKQHKRMSLSSGMNDTKCNLVLRIAARRSPDRRLLFVPIHLVQSGQTEPSRVERRPSESSSPCCLVSSFSPPRGGLGGEGNWTSDHVLASLCQN